MRRTDWSDNWPLAKEENRQLRWIIAAQKKIAEMFPDATNGSDE